MKFYILYGLFWLCYFIGFTVFCKTYLAKNSKNLLWLKLILTISALLFPVGGIYFTYDIAVVSFLKDSYCNDTMVEIGRTVDFPKSVYWKDNVKGGFNYENRFWMVAHYLDGIHLQTLAVNGNDKRIYVYTATERDFSDSRSILQQIDMLEKEYANEAQEIAMITEQEKKAFLQKMKLNLQNRKTLREKLNKQFDREIKRIVNSCQVLESKCGLENIEYFVEWNERDMPARHKIYLYADNMTIVDLKSNIQIAHAERLTHHKYKIQVDWVHTKDVGYVICGRGRLLSFDESVIFQYTRKTYSKISFSMTGEKSDTFKYIVE